MSLRRRFGHLEGQRPARREERQAPPAIRFDSRPEETLPLACALCGNPLPDSEAACASCAGATESELSSSGASRSRRFEKLGGAGMELAREMPTRQPDDQVAATVPAWRGEALPDDVAEEVRRKFGLPDPAQPEAQREEVLRWADQQMQAERRQRWIYLLAGLFFGRGLIGEVVGIVVFVLVMGGFFLWRACAG